MDLLEINEKIQRIEIEQDLLSLKIGRWCAWPILRFYISSIAAKLSADSSDIRLSFPEHARHALRDLAGFKRVIHPQVLLYVASSNRVELQNGHYKDVIFDDLLRYLAGYFKIEIVNNKYYLEHSQTALYPSDMTTSGIFLIVNILSRFLPLSSVSHLSSEVVDRLRNNFPEAKIMQKNIYRLLSTYYWAKKIYSLLIFRLKPQAILLQTAYTNHALVAAGKEAHIPVIEFQHGIVDRHHPGYSWTSSAEGFKDQMPIPDRIFLYGDYWREELSGNGFWTDEMRPVGSLRIDQYRSLSNQSVAKGILSVGRQKKIVVTTQAVDVEAMVAFLLEFVRSTTIPVEIFIKLHPRESNRQPYESAFANTPNVHIISGHEAPSTFELLSTADYHASIHSTCHYEAIGLGIPTIILPLSSYTRMLPLCEHVPGYAVIVNSPAEMNQFIKQDRRVPPELAGYYFRENAVENMLSALDELGISTVRAGDRPRSE